MNPAMTQRALAQEQIFRTWWPLAASWMLMGLELPALSAVVARLAHPEIHLAAYGGVVFPVALLIESPIIMLLAASTALSRDWASYLKIRRFMMIAGAGLTLLHVALAFTPLYDLVLVRLLNPPPEIIEPARLGLMLMLPWTWAIAYRRFHQGVLIRAGQSNAVGLGTVVRLSANILVLAVGYSLQTLPGIVVATSAVSAGVLSEALYVGWRVRPALEALKRAPALAESLTWRAFAHFYLPLVMTSLLTLLALPLGSAGMSRMPQALASLAIWPALSGILFLLRSVGIAYTEVVVALLEHPRAVESLRRFAYKIAAVTTLVPLLVAVTPLGELWFAQVSGLPAGLATLAQTALGLGFLVPGFTVLQSFFQGTLMHDRRTRGITEAVALSLLTSALILSVGVVWGGLAGVYVAQIAFVIGAAVQTLWLWRGSRSALRTLEQRERSQTRAVASELVC
ncbi:MAG: hypothetical protein RMJ90_03775 [Candidatus Bipolaricaulota bacterium]|nr:hypothetical protein [Candidatus Bipolaricaulota bacterium]